MLFSMLSVVRAHASSSLEAVESSQSSDPASGFDQLAAVKIVPESLQDKHGALLSCVFF